jgi:predicted secreted hydrolase
MAGRHISSLLLLAASLLSFATYGDETATTQSRLSELLSGEGDEGFEKAIEPRDFVFPEDHGPHPGFRNEWWYVTGNLDSDNGLRIDADPTGSAIEMAQQPGVHRALCGDRR